MRRIDELHLQHPFFGNRRMVRDLEHDGLAIGRHRVRQLIRPIGLQAIDQAPKISEPHPKQQGCSNRLDVAIKRRNHFWCADITYIPVRRNILHLAAVMDWAGRCVLVEALSKTLDTTFCVEALGVTLDRHGEPEIFNADQGSRFTGALNQAEGTVLKYSAGVSC